MSFEMHNEDIARCLAKEKRVDVNWKNKWGNVALHYAARFCKDPHIVATLGKRMTNVNSKNIDGNTPVVQAVAWRNVAAIQGLLSIPSVDWTVRNKNMKTLLVIAK